MLKKENKNLGVMRHSAEHVLTQVMIKLYPGLKMAMGPATEDGFYFDFDYSKQINEKDFPKIKKEMQKIINKNLPFKKQVIEVSEARKLFPNNPYKQEWLDEIAQRKEKAVIYRTGDEFTDLCGGPHVKSTGKIGAFKLLSVAGAYWHGDEKNKMLTRIYGTAFETKKELDEYIKMQEDAKKRDHRKLGKKLDLFIFAEEVGPGLPLLTEKGATIRRKLERFIIDEEIKRGYKHVYTPDLAKVKLYEISGHYPYYKDTMYPVMKVDEDELILRPMSCPHHFMLFKSKPRSYKELPLKIAEVAKLYRYEKSGELTGLMRVRSFCLADSHIFCRNDQAASVIKEVIDLINFVAKTLKLKKGEDYWFRLSLGDPKNKKKYYDDPKNWKQGEKILKNVLEKMKAPYVIAKDEAVFYGPKIDVQMKNVAGKEDTAFTVQYDFCMPARFKLQYINEKGKKEQPIVIHRSSIGSLERTMAFLIEHYAGNFPLWLAPEQIWVIPVGVKHKKYAENIAKELAENDFRYQLKDENESVSKKIRNGEIQRIPYLLVIGDEESKSKSVRIRNKGKDLGKIKLTEFIKKAKIEIEKYK
ncbi:MAG: threonine--tRNA ligase [Patescibacteria group bacterium]|nr:threonine--tRNA ligase [Patescibacteria group bacterium]